MCCFHLHFSNYNVLFFLPLKKITCCAKREKKITCREEKSQPPPPPDIKWSVPYKITLQNYARNTEQLLSEHYSMTKLSYL